MGKPISLILIIILIPVLASAVTLSNDDYAVEVVLNKPGTIFYSHNLDNIENLILNNNKYIAISQYSQELAAIFNQETSLTSGTSSGLAVRLQLPTKTSEIKISFINFVSLIDKEGLKPHEDFHQGWEIICTNQKCQLDKQGTEITITQTSQNRYDILIESNTELVSSGTKCFKKYNNVLCLTNHLEIELSSVLNHIGLASNFNELLTSYNILNLGTKTTTSLVSSINLKPDWQEAMRQELVNLKRKNIISMPDKDIEEIVDLIQQGKAGKNRRIVFNTDLENYEYYYKTTYPILVQEINSEPFLLPQSQNNNTLSNPYYFIPLIITIILVGVFGILIIIAKIITKKKKQKKLHPTGLLNQN